MITEHPHVAHLQGLGHDKTFACLVFRDGHPSYPPATLEQVSEVVNEPGTLVWLDVVDPTEPDMAHLRDEFNLSPLAVEDAVSLHERPKIDPYDTYWFLVVRATTIEGERVRFHEMAIFAGAKFLVTVRHDPAYPLEEIQSRWVSRRDRVCHGGGFLLYTILDTVVDGYIPVAEAIIEQVDELEASLFEDRPMGNDVLPRIFQMKKDGQKFRRAALPMRDILNQIIREDVQLFPAEELVYYRDVYDHAVRVIDELDSARDLIGSALEIHLSVVANRQNEVAKQLTVIATIFLPLSYLTGFFGQNFSFLVDHIGGTGAFVLLGIGTEVLALGLLFTYFKRKRWF